MLIKKKKGLSLVEVLISSGLTLSFMAIVTSIMATFNSNTTAQTIKETMDMDLRKAVERLEKEIMHARNIEEDIVLFDVTSQYSDEEDIPIETDASQIAFQIPAYDKNNYPLFYTNGQPKCDIVAIKMVPNYREKVRRKNPVTGVVESVSVKKLEFSLDPIQGSNRKKIYKQSIFQYYIPIDSNGKYENASDGSIVASNAPKLFSYYTQDENGEIIELTATGGQLDKARTIKVVLLAEKNYGDRFFTSKRETEIRLRNSTN